MLADKAVGGTRLAHANERARTGQAIGLAFCFDCHSNSKSIWGRDHLSERSEKKIFTDGFEASSYRTLGGWLSAFEEMELSDFWLVRPQEILWEVR